MGFAKSIRAASVATDITARYTVWELTTDPAKPVVLIVRPATEPNNGFLNAVFKLPSMRRTGNEQMSIARMHATNVEAVEPYADHVIIGWENVVEDDGSTPHYTPAKGRELLAALIRPPPDGRPDLFVNLRLFCGNIENFREPVVEAAELGKA